MTLINQAVVEEIRHRVDIIDVVSGYVSLKKAGRSFKGLCPFHREKTPSFVVTPEKQIYHCFGCGKGGDVFNFVMEMEGLGFVETARMLAQKAGVVIPEGPKDSRAIKRKKESELIRAANKVACRWFKDQLKSSRWGGIPRNYLKHRQISQDSIEFFDLGYAPESWNSLIEFMTKQDFSREILIKSGLAKKGKTSAYDAFRNRLIFPIKSISGDVIAFGGRILSDQEPKYLNSPETPVYRKSSSIFGLHQARSHIRDAGFAIIVEGYFDVIGLADRGIKNVVAPLGTSLTENQIQILRRYSTDIYLMFDSDAGGIKAVLRSIEMLLGFELNQIRVVMLPEGDDPDDIARREGPEKLNSLIAEAPDAFDFLFRHFFSGKCDSLPEQTKIVNSMLPYIQKLPSRFKRSYYIERLAEKLKVDDSLLLDELNKVKKNRIKKVSPTETACNPAYEIESQLLWLILNEPHKASWIFSEISWEIFHCSELKKIAREIYRILLEGKKPSFNSVCDRLNDPSLKSELSRLCFPQRRELHIDEINKDATLNGCLQNLKNRIERQEDSILQNAIKDAEKEKNDEELRRLILERQRRRREEAESFNRRLNDDGEFLKSGF